MNSNSDLKAYRPLLCRIATYSNRSDFEVVFKQIMEKSKIDKSTSFLLKMELKRLQKPCNIPVDLRGLVDDDCELYIHNEVAHYFDDIAKSVFEEQCKNFNGYTVGVYESVTNTINNYRVMHEKEKNGIKVDLNKIRRKKISTKKYFDIIEFNNFHTRKEERMHYVSDVYLIKNDIDSYIGKSIDISVSGCQLKVKKEYLPKTGSVIELIFKKLNDEFELSLKSNLKYQIVSVAEHDEYNILGLKRIHCKDTDKFDEFLSNYIIGNKRRYKINLDNTIESVYSRGYSQYSLPRRSDLNIFIKENKKCFMGIATESNREIMEYWKDSSSNICINSAFSEEKISFLIEKMNKGIKDSYLYVFKGINKNKEIVFYSLFEDEIIGKEGLRDSFCKLGIDKYSFKVFCVSISQSSSDYAYQPFSLMNNEIEVFRNLNKKPSTRNMIKLKGLSHVISVRDITTKGFIEDFKGQNIQYCNISEIKSFKLPKAEKLDIIPIKSIDIRKENRYKIKTEASIRIEKLELTGETVDLSTKGLRIKINEDHVIKKGEKIKVSLPEFNLVNLSYSVVHFIEDKKEVCLVVNGDIIEHKGRIFLRNLFNKNKNNLVDYQIGDNNEELSFCIQNILSCSSTNLSAYLNRQGFRSLIKKVSLGNNDKDFTSNLISNEKIELGFLMKESIYNSIVKDKLRSGNCSNSSASENIYISIQNDEIKAVSEKDFKNIEDKKEFIQNANEKGKFYCINSSFSRAGRPDMTKIGVELNYISVYAMHKGQELEDELWSINGIIDIKDITNIIERTYMSYN